LQGPNGQPVTDATGWQNGSFDSSLGPVLQARGLRLVPPQQQGVSDSSAFMQSPVDQAAASGAAPVPPEDLSELLKLRSIIQAVGSRGPLSHPVARTIVSKRQDGMTCRRQGSSRALQALCVRSIRDPTPCQNCGNDLLEEMTN
jgi:hypothetical protein